MSIKFLYQKLVNLLTSNIDKVFHQDFVTVINLFMVTLSCFILKNLGWSILLGSIITIFIFIGKEIYDKYKKDNPSGFDLKDILADLIGLLLCDIPLIILWMILF